MADPQRQANSFVGTLAQLQDSAQILQSNEQAAREALERVTEARAEEAETRARTEKLLADQQVAWRNASQEVEGLTILAQQMRLRAQQEYDAQVSAGAAAGQKAHDAWRDRTIAAEVEHSQKCAEIVETDKEVAERRARLEEVKREMANLAARLKP